MKTTTLTVESAVSIFGATAAAKLSKLGATGNPEDQLRAPVEQLLLHMAELCSLRNVVCIGESALGQIHLRPDYAVTVEHLLAGFIEIKAPGKGADPRKFTVAHDKSQGEKLRSLPNVLFTDGNSFSLWQDGELIGSVLTLKGNIETSGANLAPMPGLQLLFESFLRWNPSAPATAKELAHSTARLCRFLRDEATEQLALRSPGLTALAKDWRRLLFPDADDKRFADGYAQAVTFGLLMARAKGIVLDETLQHAADELSHTSTLIGAALHLLTEDPENREALRTSLLVLIRVLSSVDWAKISYGQSDAWLYFYEEFLAIYDNKLRKLTGSYYTPPEVVGAMVSLVDEVLRSTRFDLHTGLASPAVTIADPATGTGTFILGVLRRIAHNVASDQGEGAVPDAIVESLRRIIGFEIQLGPFAVAQLRILAEVLDLAGAGSTQTLRMFVTNTLGNPDDEEGHITGLIPRSIAQSRRDANKVKREETITVVIGNPPYKEKAKGKGGWVEGQSATAAKSAPLRAWVPPKAWGLGVYARHLRNLYIYFWRWATWKVFDPNPFKPGSGPGEGVVCFISGNGFLSGEAFQKMRDYLRRTCDDIWVIDCSPDGHQPKVNTRIFQGVQQPVCIVIASRSKHSAPQTPAALHFTSLPPGDRKFKFESLARLRINQEAWVDGPRGWRDPFLPQSDGAWSTYPKIEDLFLYNGTGLMPGRTWIIAPDRDSLLRRWTSLKAAPPVKMDELFTPHIRNGEYGDCYPAKEITDALHGFPVRLASVKDESEPCISPVHFGFRSLDRQWIIPDKRLINQPNPKLWEIRSDRQIFFTAPWDRIPSDGPALSATALIPDAHHYAGRGGRVFPLWADADASQPNVKPTLISYLSTAFGKTVIAEDLFSYIAAIAASPAYISRFRADLSTPGLRIPITSDPELFREVVEMGRRVLWLHTFGERMADPNQNRPAGPPRVPVDPPFVPLAGRISGKPEDFPDGLTHDIQKQRLLVGNGYIENVSAKVWSYQFSGKHVLPQWFSYRRKNRERPIIGDRRPPSKLNDIQPDHWLSEYTAELLNLLNVITLLVELEPAQADLLERICAGSLFSNDALSSANALTSPHSPTKLKKPRSAEPKLF